MAKILSTKLLQSCINTEKRQILFFLIWVIFRLVWEYSQESSRCFCLFFVQFRVCNFLTEFFDCSHCAYCLVLFLVQF